ncbi:FAD-dependent oxidoreductase [uncultured Mailhella sp.]|uniref:FAD-dependent oxidoreductase n=1 Tax=uncultured Mailhella sp. TaxID=1981031 RepID=UPI0025E4D946|nr:FAD-dependent oxidoreductase [uncultured Mailhella sp.]
MIPVSKTIDADVVIVGGGIGGAMAAIAASESGAKRVVVLEKCHVKRSGSGATGNDHFSCYIPEVHGDDVEPVLTALMNSLVGQAKDVELMRLHLLESFDIVKKWEEWGINMRPLGRWNFQGHALPGKPRAFLKFDGRKQKAVLAEQMKKHGVTVLNHHPVVELAKENGRVCGALAIDASTPDPSFVLVSAPCVILSTGLTHRLYVNGTTPNYLFNTAHCPNNAGGQALGWRIGASMVNMEIPYTHAGTKYLQRAGKATWIGVYRYPDGKPLGPFVTKPDPEYGDVTSDIWNSAFLDVMHNGRGPAYLDCSENTPETLAYMRKAMFDEGLSALIAYMDAKGIDPARHAVEFTRFEPILHGRGLDVDKNGQTTVPGLYAAGDMVGNAGCGLGLAAWMGWRAGHAAAADAANSTGSADLASNPAIKAKMELLSSFMSRNIGAEWQEANIALTQIMSDYANVGPYNVRSETLLKAGLGYLAQLREETNASMKASCSHTLMRAAEVLDLFDCAECIMRSALERKETRGNHKRSDYTFTNPLLADKMLDVTRKDDGSVVTSWRNMKH